MKILAPLSRTVLAVLFFSCPAPADDAADIEAEMMRFLAALNSGDVEGFMDHYAPSNTSFVPGDPLLIRYDSLEAQRRSWQASVDAGQKLNLELRHLEVKLFGKLTALVTCYVVGTSTSPHGITRPVRWQRSAVMVKQGHAWKEVHHHRSDLVIPEPPGPEDRFIGSWDLVSLKFTAGDGSQSAPFGENPLGRITYMADGTMSAFVLRRDRPPFASEDFLRAASSEIRSAFEGSIAYFGSFSVQEGTGRITHHVEGAVFPNRIGIDQARFFEFEGDRLILKTPPLPRGGQEVVGTVIWRRRP